MRLYHSVSLWIVSASECLIFPSRKSPTDMQLLFLLILLETFRRKMEYWLERVTDESSTSSTFNSYETPWPIDWGARNHAPIWPWKKTSPSLSYSAPPMAFPSKLLGKTYFFTCNIPRIKVSLLSKAVIEIIIIALLLPILPWIARKLGVLAV